MNLRLFAAIFFLSSAAILYMIGKPKLSKEYTALQSSIGNNNESDYKLLSGKIIPSKDSVWQDFIIVNKESFTGTGKLNGWKVDTSYIQPFELEVENQSVKVQLQEVPNRGTQLSVLPLEELTEKDFHIRMKGLKAGSQLTLIGSFNSEAKIFEATYAYAGYVEAYSLLLEEGARLINQIIIVLLCIGFVFLGWHFWSKKNKAIVS